MQTLDVEDEVILEKLSEAELSDINQHASSLNGEINHLLITLENLRNEVKYFEQNNGELRVRLDSLLIEKVNFQKYARSTMSDNELLKVKLDQALRENIHLQHRLQQIQNREGLSSLILMYEQKFSELSTNNSNLISQLQKAEEDLVYQSSKYERQIEALTIQVVQVKRNEQSLLLKQDILIEQKKSVELEVDRLQNLLNKLTITLEEINNDYMLEFNNLCSQYSMLETELSRQYMISNDYESRCVELDWNVSTLRDGLKAIENTYGTHSRTLSKGAFRLQNDRYSQGALNICTPTSEQGSVYTTQVTPTKEVCYCHSTADGLRYQTDCVCRPGSYELVEKEWEKKPNYVY